jgi:hypothetical protein
VTDASPTDDPERFASLLAFTGWCPPGGRSLEKMELVLLLRHADQADGVAQQVAEPFEGRPRQQSSEPAFDAVFGLVIK